MHQNNHSQLQVVYVGNNKNLIDEFESNKEMFLVKQFDNGLKADGYIKSGSTIDAIICESTVQGINCLDYANLIKSLPDFQKTPFILISPEKDKELEKKSYAIKGIVDDFYTFPFKIKNIHNRIFSVKNYYSEISNNKIKKNKIYKYRIPFMKRAFDIAVSLTALILLAPILILVALAIRIESKGQIIYKSKRVGTGYRIFDFLKFRSMYTGADARLKELKHLNQYSNDSDDVKDEDKEIFNSDCPQCAKLPEGEHCSPLLFIEGQMICESWYTKQKKQMGGSAFVKISNDPRVTKVGNFIRNTSIDELPQLFNVLKGDMSIVGNRPLPLYEAELLTSDDWSLRFMGPAGITGLWQVELRGRKGAMSEDERKTLDNQYAKNYSFWGDIVLILRTIPALLQKDNV
jgi:lipopolysaccharide/colanic/teichoic acid biosynthesis glycosyltransferase